MIQNFREGSFKSLALPMLIGGGAALLLMTFFLAGVETPDPEWGRYWMVRPMLVITFAGSVGGIFYYYMGHLRVRGGWNRFAADLISLIVFIIGLWLGAVLGLNGTLWN